MTNGSDKTDRMGLTKIDRMDAYAAVKERFGLKAKQRDMLDAAMTYTHIMFFAKNLAWDHVEYFLRQEGIIA